MLAKFAEGFLTLVKKTMMTTMMKMKTMTL